MDHVCFSLNILSAYVNFLCDLKILSKVVPNGSNLMRDFISQLKIVACMGNIDTMDKGKRMNNKLNNLLKHKHSNKSSYKSLIT